MKLYDFTKDKIQFVPRSEIHPGSARWVFQASCLIQNYANNLGNASDQLLAELKEVLPHKPWLTFPEGSPANSPDRYFEVLLGLTWAQLKQAIVLIKDDYEPVLDELERQNLAGLAGGAVTVGLRGRPAIDENCLKVDEEKSVNLSGKPSTKPSGHGGNSATYRIGKLKRDFPEIGDRLEAGEFRTVAEAERAAGVGRPIMTKVERVLAAIDRLSPAEVEIVLERLISQQREKP